MRSKYFTKQISIKDAFYGKNNALFSLKNLMKNKYYSIGINGGNYKYNSKIQNKFYSN